MLLKIIISYFDHIARKYVKSRKASSLHNIRGKANEGSNKKKLTELFVPKCCFQHDTEPDVVETDRPPRFQMTEMNTMLSIEQTRKKMALFAS